jgi:nucleoside phosphorylase
MSNSVRDIQRRALERRLVALIEEYEAINRQSERTTDAAHLIKLQRQEDDILKEMNEIKDRLNALGASNTPLHATAPSRDPQVDFVIGAALEEERDAVLAKLPGAHRLNPSPGAIRIYYTAQVPVTVPGGVTGTYEVRVLLLGKGQEEATLAAAEAIQRWRPRYIVVVGIAGGITTNGIGLGDVLVADQIVGYEMQKVRAKGADVHWNVYKVAKGMELHARDLRANEWQPLVTAVRPEPGEPKCYIGPIASGNKVIAYGDVVRRYQGVWSQLIGVEMEAAGVAAAAFQQAQAIPFFMVRGVSDLADEAKDSVEVKRWRAYACDVAAAYTVALLGRGPIPLTV